MVLVCRGPLESWQVHYSYRYILTQPRCKSSIAYIFSHFEPRLSNDSCELTQKVHVGPYYEIFFRSIVMSLLLFDRLLDIWKSLALSTSPFPASLSNWTYKT
jgi:hypothetical protein